MQISQYEWNEMNKKIADIEEGLQSQRDLFLTHLDAHEKENRELLKIIANIKTEIYRGIEQIS